MDVNPNGEATFQACNALLVEADAFDPLTIPNSPFHDRAVKIEAYRKIAEMDNSVYFCKPSTIETFFWLVFLFFEELKKETSVCARSTIVR